MFKSFLTGCGKLNNNNNKKMYLNIITIYKTGLAASVVGFLSHNKVSNYSDFIDAVNYSTSEGKNLPICFGYFIRSSTENYSPIHIYYSGDGEQYVSIAYRVNAEKVASSRVGSKIKPDYELEYFTL